MVGIVHWTNASIIASFLITVQWVGWWNLLAYNIWADSWAVVRDTVYILVGCVMLFVAEKWIPLSSIETDMAEEWAHEVPKTFSIPRKLTNYLKSYIHFLAFLFFWVGAWTVFDEYFPRTTIRDICYVLFPIPLIFISQEVLSRESLCWYFLKYNEYKKTSSSPYIYIDKENEKSELETDESSPLAKDNGVLNFSKFEST